MPDTIPNLWPPEIKVDVQTPYTILRVQANFLAQITRGTLQSTVETEMGETKVQHRLVVIAPAYHGYRHTLIKALHHRDLPYPVEIQAEPFLAEGEEDYPVASDESDMLSLVQEALRSPQTRSLLASLLAKSNEATGLLAAAPTTNGPQAPAESKDFASPE